MAGKRKPNGYWDVYENCYSEAKKYTTITDFIKKGACAYNHSVKNGWIEKFTWLERERVHRGYWDSYYNCLEEAKKYKTFHEFRALSGSCANASMKNGWIDDFVWLVKGVGQGNHNGKPVCQYTLDGKFAKRFDSIAAATKETGARNIDSCLNFKNTQSGGFRWLYESDSARAEEIFAEHPLKCNLNRVFHTVEEVIEEAKKYKYFKDFVDNSYGHYLYAKRHGIIGMLNLEKKLDVYKDKLYSVYAYFFQETHSVYVGVTCDKERRDKQHRDFSQRSQVSKHSKEYGVDIPDPVYIEENVSPYDALDIEDKWRNKYKEDGWNVLNVAPTGQNASLGAACKRVTNKEIREAASQCTYIGEFADKYTSLYYRARERGIINDLGLKRQVKPKGTLTEEYCYNLARECKTMAELRNKDESVYGASIKNRWIDEYWWLYNPRLCEVLVWKGYRVIVFESVRKAALYFNTISHSSKELADAINKDGWRVMPLGTDYLEWYVPEFSQKSESTPRIMFDC